MKLAKAGMGKASKSRSHVWCLKMEILLVLQGIEEGPEFSKQMMKRRVMAIMISILAMRTTGSIVGIIMVIVG